MAKYHYSVLVGCAREWMREDRVFSCLLLVSFSLLNCFYYQYVICTLSVNFIQLTEKTCNSNPLNEWMRTLHQDMACATSAVGRSTVALSDRALSLAGACVQRRLRSVCPVCKMCC